MKTLPPPADTAAFEARIREVGEVRARLENVAELMVELLEARRDFRLEQRGQER